MTKAEKRYLKLNGSGSTKKYLLLFEAIEAQREYDEPKLLKKFAGEAFIKQFAVSKHYLFQTILRSLREFHLGRSVESETIILWQEAGLLKSRMLFGPAFKHIKKAERNCIDNDMLEHFPLIIERKKEILEKLPLKNSEKRAELKKIREMQSDAIEKLRLRMRLTSFIAELRHLISTGRPISDNLKAEVLTFLNHSTDPSLSAFTKLRFQQLDLLVNILLETAAENDALSRLLAIVDSEPKLVQFRGVEIIGLFKEIGDSLLRSGSIEARVELLSVIRGVQTFPATMRGLYEITISILEIKHLLLRGELKKADAAIESIDPRLLAALGQDEGFELRSELSFWQAYSSFSKKNYEIAKQYAQDLLDMEEKSNDEPLRVAAGILQLLSYFELKQYEPLEYLHRSTVSYILQSEHLFEYEMAFLNAIRRTPGFDTKEAEKAFYLQMENKVSRVAEGAQRSISPEMRFLAPWISSKIRG